MLTDLPANTDEPGKHNPLSEHWENGFFKAHTLFPGDEDRQDQLISLIICGSGPAGSWGEGDWVFYRKNRKALWEGNERWPAENIAVGYGRFQIHLERLAAHYGNDRDSRANFARAAGLIWGGIAYQGSTFMALARASVGDHLLQLHEGSAGWLSQYVDDANPAHHWVAAFLTGYQYGTMIGVTINSIRDIAQYVTLQGGTRGDIYLGNVAARHGHLLSRGFDNHAKPYNELFARMKRELAINGANNE